MVQADAREKGVAALAAASVVSALLAAIIAGLNGPHLTAPTGSALETILPSRSVPEAKPSPQPSSTPSPRPKADPGGSTGRQDRAPAKPGPTPAAAPAPGALPAPAVVIMPTPAPLSPSPAVGTIGRGEVPGGGTGGNGTGGGGGLGGSGSGSGSGQGYGSGSGFRLPARLPRQTGGRLHFSELPEDLRQRREGAVLTLRYQIGTDGRVSQCRVVVSSGRADLDARTCALITERFRFRPARDEQGRPVAFTMTEIHGWDDAPTPGD